MTRNRPEPALVFGLIAAGLSLGTALGIPGLSAGQTAVIIAVISGGYTVVVAFRTRPVGPAAFTGLVNAIAALTAAYGFELSQEVVGAVSALVISGLAILNSLRVTAIGADGALV